MDNITAVYWVQPSSTTLKDRYIIQISVPGEKRKIAEVKEIFRDWSPSGEGWDPHRRHAILLFFKDMTEGSWAHSAVPKELKKITDLKEVR